MADAFIHYPNEPLAHSVVDYQSGYNANPYNTSSRVTFDRAFPKVPIVSAVFSNSSVSVGNITTTYFECNCNYAPWNATCTWQAFVLE